MKAGGEWLHERWSILNALDGVISPLANRLRRGTASRDEQFLAADLIEGKIKPRRLRPPRLLNELMVYTYFLTRLGHPDLQEKQIIGEVANLSGVSGRHVYNVLSALGPEERKFYERLACKSVTFIRDNPKVFENRTKADVVAKSFLDRLLEDEDTAPEIARK